jgi:hypothetical protein
MILLTSTNLVYITNLHGQQDEMPYGFPKGVNPSCGTGMLA